MWSNGIFFGWASLVAVVFALPNAIPTYLRAYRIPGLVLLSVVIWFVFALTTRATRDDLAGFIGQVVLATAFSLVLIPWLRSALSGISATTDEKLLNAQEARFKLLTLAVAGVAVIRLALPYLGAWAPRTSSLEVGFFKLALSEPRRTGHDLELTATNGRSIGDDATRAVGALSRIVSMGHKEGLGSQQIGLSYVLQRPGTYSDKPMVARDLLITRYLASRGDPKEFATLSHYGLDRETEELFEKNFSFARQLATPLRCVAIAAELTRDYRLVMLDVHPLVRWLMRLSLFGNASGPTTAITTRTEGPTTRKDVDGWNDLLNAARRTYLGSIGSDEVGAAEVALVCADSKDVQEAFTKLRGLSDDLTQYSARDPDDPNVIALRRSPYPTMATAWLLGGIGGTEAAISILARWISQHPLPTDSDVGKSGKVWLRSRAIIELDLLIPNDMLDAGNEV